MHQTDDALMAGAPKLSAPRCERVARRAAAERPARVCQGLYLARQLTGALLIDQRGDGVTATFTVGLPTAG